MEYLDINKIKLIHNENEILSLNYDGKLYNAIKLKRCFPFEKPSNYISVCDSETNEEIGIILDLNLLDSTNLKIAENELKFRYFMPIITKINKVKEKRNIATLDVTTNAGKKVITIQDIPFNITLYPNGQVILKDIDGNLYEIDNKLLLSKDKNSKFILNYI